MGSVHSASSTADRAERRLANNHAAKTPVHREAAVASPATFRESSMGGQRDDISDRESMALPCPKALPEAMLSRNGAKTIRPETARHAPAETFMAETPVPEGPSRFPFRRLRRNAALLCISFSKKSPFHLVFFSFMNILRLKPPFFRAILP